MKKFLFFFLLNILSFHYVVAKDSLTVDLKLDKDWCASVTSDVASWIEGYQMGSDVLSIYMNVTTYEFQDFLELNNTDELTLRVFWRSNAGNQIRREADYIIDSTEPDFDIRNWTAIHEPADLEGGFYVVQVLIDGSTCSEFIPIIMVEDIDEEEELPIDLPAYNCGEDYTYEDLETNNLASAVPGDIFFIGGFPILLETVSGGNGTFSGTGVIPLPFDRKVVSVEFTGVAVNQKRKITSGPVMARGDDPENYPNFNPDTDVVNIGGEICIPVPETPGYENGGVDENGLNPRGFDPTTAVHSETGTPFDPTGFDMNGNHQNGTPYNECGCSIEGLTEDNEVCDITCGPNPAAEAFADNMAADLPNDVTTIINLLVGENQTLLDGLGCPQIRTEIINLNQTLDFDPVFVFGENNKYLNEDMHLHFAERPQPLPVNISTRDPQAVLLENRHVDLYDCDKQAYAVKAYIATLNFLNEGDQKDNFVAATLEKIRNWSEYMLNLMSDEDEFQRWLAGEIGQYMMDNSGLDHSYHNLFVDQTVDEKEFLENRLKSIFDFNQRRGTHHDMASIEEEMVFDDAFTLEDASFLFRQGHQKINGVDRAFYLEELAKKQSLAVSDNAPQLMPIVVDKTIGNKTYTIYLDQIVFSPTGASVDAFLIITDPESGKRIIFKGMNIGFGPTGLQGESRLSLESEVQVRLNNSAMLILNPSGETFVEWDCEGFSRMGIDAGIEFCRNFITPLDPVTMEPVEDEEARYRFDIVTVMDSWLEFNLTLPGGDPFAVTKYEDIKWQFNDVIIDFSSASTADFEPPEGFVSPFYDGGQMSDLWKGVFIGNLSVQFPNSFSSGSEPITASATNILIDGGGFSGGLSVTNLITIEEGNLGGWPFSIDEFHLKILNNQYAGAGMGGKVNVPIFEENLDYRAAVYPDNEYHFSVVTQSDLTADVFVATVTLEENSAIDVSYVEGEFTAIATLNGTMEVNTGGNPDAEFSLGLPKIRFQDFQISNQPTYFNAGNWGIDTNGGPIASVGFNGFGIKLYGISPYNIGETGAGVEFDLEVKLVDNDKVGVAARGIFGVEGQISINSNNRQSWDFERVRLNTLAVDTHFPGVKRLYGFVNWYDEVPQYGEGFQGQLSLHLAKVDIEVEAAAQFGKIEDHKYFFVDAFVKLGAAAPSIGVMKFTGFGGGVSYGMTMTQNNVSLANAPDASQGIQLPPIGSGLSGTVFTPNVDTGLAIKAACSLATAQEDIFNGTAGLSFTFSAGGGLDQIAFFGSGHFLKGVDLGIEVGNPDNTTSTPPAVEAPLSAYINLEINFNNSFSLDGTLRTFLNTPFLEGDPNHGGLLVSADLHFSREEWYIYIGTPDQPCNINLDVPFIDVGVTAYFDIGTNVPPMPPLPANVREIAYKVNTNSSLRQSGAGFVFGAALNVSIGVKAGGLISATVEGGAGFDISLRKYNNLSCQGSSGPVGIDGWYATGQIWAYIQGEVKIFGAPIFSAGLAAVLQARLPNPFFAQATVGVRVKIGFIKFNKSLSLKLGNDCILVSDDPNDEVGIDIIPYVNPTNGAESIETDARITGPVNVPLNRNVEVSTPNGAKDYRVEVLSHTITTDQGIELENHVIYDHANSQISLRPTSFLPGNTTITAIIELEIKESGEVIATQADTTVFVTAPDMEIIPETNIDYVYPINGMQNFYPQEQSENRGYLKMDAYQSVIVDQLEEDSYMRFTDSDGNVMHVPIVYNYLANQIEFIIGDDLLENEKGYKMELVHYTQNQVIPPTAIHAVAPAGTRRLNTGGLLSTALGGSTLNLDPPAAGSTTSDVVNVSEEVFYTSYFRVSKYNTFNEKMNDILVQNDTKWFVKNIENESFDRTELEGIKELDPMITVASGTNNPQLNNIGDFYNTFPKVGNAPYGCPDTIHFSSELNAPGKESISQIGYNELTLPAAYSEETFLENLPAQLENQSIGYTIFQVSAHVGKVKRQLEDCALNYDIPEPGIHALPPPGEPISVNDACDYYPYDEMCGHYGEDVVKWLFVNQLSYAPSHGNYPVHISYKLPGLSNTPSSTVTVTFINQ